MTNNMIVLVVETTKFCSSEEFPWSWYLQSTVCTENTQEQKENCTVILHDLIEVLQEESCNDLLFI